MENIKKFEDFLGKIQGLIDNAKKQGHITVRVEDLENAFSELKDNEDEKIRKALISLFSNNAKKDWYDIPTKKILAWLEKQGNQKPTDKVEPRFKEGDWVIDKGIVYQIANVIENVTNHTYGYDIVGGGYFNDDTEGVRYWNIQDAKDGDVLQLGQVTAIFKKFIGNNHCRCYCSVCNGEFEIPSQDSDESIYGCHNATPPTKEQRDFLFQKMANEGYNFNRKTKKLIKVVPKQDTHSTLKRKSL